jgi:type IV secretory pathway VirB10-like protein
VLTTKLFSSCLFVLGLALVSSAAIAQQDQSQASTGDPVADAARKAREQKKLAPKPKKVFTDDDIAPKPAPDAPAPAQTSPSSDKSDDGAARAKAAVSKTDGSEKKEDPNSEAVWRKRFAAQRKKIADAEEALSVLQREAEKADLQYYSDPQKALQEQYTRSDINAKNEKIAERKKEIANLKQQLSDLEDQLRSAGGDPGWAR